MCGVVIGGWGPNTNASNRPRSTGRGRDVSRGFSRVVVRARQCVTRATLDWIGFDSIRDDEDEGIISSYSLH